MVKIPVRAPVGIAAAALVIMFICSYVWNCLSGVLTYEENVFRETFLRENISRASLRNSGFWEHPTLFIFQTKVFLHLQEPGFFRILLPLTTLFLQFPRSGGKRREVHTMAMASNNSFKEGMPKTEHICEERLPLLNM